MVFPQPYQCHSMFIFTYHFWFQELQQTTSISAAERVTPSKFLNPDKRFYPNFDIDVSTVKPGLFPAILGKGPWPKLEKKLFNLTSKLGKINDIEHNKGRNIYPQNQAILDCIMSSIPLTHKYVSINLIWVIVSHK